jgi:eukaryotic-like serine/threonine-protein kinase
MAEPAQIVAGIREGDTLAGKYRIDRILGVGGMGVVVGAHHVQLDERVAIKFLLPETVGNPETLARFLREARAAAKIKSEHVARVTDVGALGDGAPYMVMEYLEGSDLAVWIRQQGALAVEQAVDFILQASEAIAEAHAAGIVHRDLKPGNLFVTRQRDGALAIKVLDFGISKTTGLGGSGLEGSITKTSALMGSPLYMSPEQMRSSKDVDARSDIWALGVILYELVSGAQPFKADTMPELVVQIMEQPPPPLHGRRSDLPLGLDAVVARCLEKDRGKRFESIGAMAIALLPYAPKRSKISVERITGTLRSAGYSASALVVPPSSDADAGFGAGTDGSWGRTATKSHGTKRFVTVALSVSGLALVVLTLVGVGHLLRGSTGTSSAVAPDAASPVVHVPAVTGTSALPVASTPPEGRVEANDAGRAPVSERMTIAKAHPTQQKESSARAKGTAGERDKKGASMKGAESPAPVAKEPDLGSLIDDRR